MPDVVPDPTQLSRLELLQLAQSLGVSDADVMTRVELRAAIDKARRPEPRATEHPITWVSVARRLLASVVERGLNLPDAASLIRGDTKLTTPPKAPPPVATVTLARIYGAQGHVDRAISTLDEVLESDPDHEIARELRNQLELRRVEILARDASAEPPATGDDRPGNAEPPRGPEGAASARDGAPAAAASNESLTGDALPDEGASAGLELPPSEAGSRDRSQATTAPSAELPLAFDRSSSADPSLSAEPPPFIEPPPSAEPPPYIDAQPSAEAPSPAAASSAALSPVESAAVSLSAETVTSVAPAAAISPDASAELVAPTFDVVERDVHTSDVATELPPPGAYTEPPTMVSTVSLGLLAPLQPSVYPETVYPETASPETVYPETAYPEIASADTASPETGPPPTIASEIELRASPPSLEPRDIAPLRLEPPAGLEPPAVANEPAQSPNGLSNGFIPAASANGVPPLAAPVPSPEPSAPLPHVPGLVLIETDSAIRYVYWELAASSPGAPHWIHVVSHTPTARGAPERHERRFPVHHPLGALRLEGVPPEAVVRARLTDANDTRLLVVAGAVRPRAPGAGPFEISYTPHRRARPEALATRAQPLLERASAVYWDW